MICRLVEKSARLSGPFVLFTSPYRLGRDFASVGGFLIWVLTLLARLLIWILTLLAALVRIVSHFDLHIGQLAVVFRRAALAASKDREFQETIRQHSSLDF
jgi:hypothetical protein